MEDILLILLSVIFALLVFTIGVSLYCFIINRKFNQLLEKGGIKDFKQILMTQKDKNAEIDKKIKETVDRIKILENISKHAIQKTAVIKFDPFNEMGGKQSFVIALLDKENNGLVISSLFVREGNRVYSKSIKNGKSDVLLSAEEIEAIDKAMNSK